MPPKRRASVNYRADYDKWRVRWRTPAGKQRELWFDTKATAELEAKRRTQLLRGEIPATPALRTVGELIALWWDEYAESPALKDNTRYLYSRCVDRILETDLAETYAAAIDTAAINNWSADLPAPPSDVRNCLVVLSSMFRWAKGRGMVVSNPVTGADRPVVKRSTLVIPTLADVARMGMVVPAPDAKWRSLLLVAAFMGLRPQEQFALRWKNVHPTYVRIDEAVSGRTREIEDPKTENATRRVPLPSAVRDWLTTWRNQSPTPADNDRIWQTSIGTPYESSRFNARIWVPWRERAGVAIQHRHLRHFYASQLAAMSEANPLQASRWMGHSKYSFTMDLYADLFEDDTDTVREAFANRLGS